MASSLRKPDILKFDGNVPENLRIFFLEYDIYVDAAHPKVSNETKVKIMLNLAGREAIERSQNFQFDNAEKRKDPAEWKKKFEEICAPMKNLTILRHNFFSRTQKADESFSTFLTDLRNMADICEFEGMKNAMLKDRIVCGIHSDLTRNHLFTEAKLDLKRAIEICELHEGAEKASATLKKEAEVCVVRKHKSAKRSQRDKRSSRRHQSDDDESESEECGYCGQEHEPTPMKCPAYGKFCESCGKRNHNTKVCRSKKQASSYGKAKASNRINELTYDCEYKNGYEGNNFIIE